MGYKSKKESGGKFRSIRSLANSSLACWLICSRSGNLSYQPSPTRPFPFLWWRPIVYCPSKLHICCLAFVPRRHPVHITSSKHTGRIGLAQHTAYIWLTWLWRRLTTSSNHNGSERTADFLFFSFFISLSFSLYSISCFHFDFWFLIFAFWFWFSLFGFWFLVFFRPSCFAFSFCLFFFFASLRLCAYPT